jgi:hypothetical protein
LYIAFSLISLISLISLSSPLSHLSSIKGIIGDVMFWSVKKCIGEAYCEDTHSAWVKIFSKMLSVIVPVSVAYELESG